MTIDPTLAAILIAAVLAEALLIVRSIVQRIGGEAPRRGVCPEPRAGRPPAGFVRRLP